MNSKFQTAIDQRNLLKVIVKIYQWESLQQREFQTRSGRDLYYRVAESLLNDQEQTMQLKLMNGSMSERTTRVRRKDFEESGWIQIENGSSDLRAKQAIPTEKFVSHLNLHLHILRRKINEEFLLIEKH